PADLLPLAVDQLDRRLEAALAVRVLAHRGALGAVGTQVEGAVPARLLSGPDAVLHLGDHRAAHRAVRADGLLQLDLAGAGRRGLSLPDTPERQRRGGRQATRRQTGAPQEGTTVDGTADHAGIRLRQTRAASSPIRLP